MRMPCVLPCDCTSFTSGVACNVVTSSVSFIVKKKKKARKQTEIADRDRFLSGVSLSQHLRSCPGVRFPRSRSISPCRYLDTWPESSIYIYTYLGGTRCTAQKRTRRLIGVDGSSDSVSEVKSLKEAACQLGKRDHPYKRVHPYLRTRVRARG